MAHMVSQISKNVTGYFDTEDARRQSHKWRPGREGYNIHTLKRYYAVSPDGDPAPPSISSAHRINRQLLVSAPR